MKNDQIGGYADGYVQYIVHTDDSSVQSSEDFSRNFSQYCGTSLALLVLSSERDIKMKPNKASLLLPLLTILFSIALSGCYTQLAFVDNDPDSAIEALPTDIYQPKIIPVYVTTPYVTPPPAVIYQMPAAGFTSSVTEPQSQSRTRESGYQRSSQSAPPQTANPVSEIRTSGQTRGGR
jgi:hypothetical protein